jgi:hypothetical protein
MIEPRSSVRRRCSRIATTWVDVRLFSDEDELGRLSAIGDALPLRHVLDEINRRADERQRAGDDRNIGEIRVDELTDAVLQDQTRLAHPATRRRQCRLVQPARLQVHQSAERLRRVHPVRRKDRRDQLRRRHHR